jgi:excisionase family DNA binding protein
VPHKKKVIPRSRVIPAVPVPTDSELLTLPQVAYALQISESCLRAWVLNKKGIPVTRVGDTIRFSRDAVDAYIAAHTTAVQAAQ